MLKFYGFDMITRSITVLNDPFLFLHNKME